MIKDYIDNGFVEIFDWRGVEKPHLKAINDCYIRNNIYYDWLIFYDIDEYIHIPNNIKDFLNEKKFDNCKKIYLNWVFHTDNNLIYYDNRTLWERFPDIERDAIINKNYSQRVKSILRGNISNFKIANNSFGSHIYIIVNYKAWKKDIEKKLLNFINYNKQDIKINNIEDHLNSIGEYLNLIYNNQLEIINYNSDINNPKISFISPVCNKNKYLTPLILSIQHQLLQDFEIININAYLLMIIQRMIVLK